PKCPDNALITKLALSSITSTAGSFFLSDSSGDMSRITAPNEKIQIRASWVLKTLDTRLEALSSNHVTSPCESLCFDCAYICAVGRKDLSLRAISMPCLVIQIMPMLPFMNVRH